MKKKPTRKRPADVVRPSPEVEAAFVAGKSKARAAATSEPAPAGRPRSRVPLRVPISTRVLPELLDKLNAAVDARSQHDNRRFTLIEALEEAIGLWVAKEAR